MSTTRKPWSREELLILLNLYEKIPFGKFDQGNPVLVDVARRMEAYKYCSLGQLIGDLRDG